MKTNIIRALALASAMLTAPALVHAELPGAASGSWYDLAHPGHGLSVEVLDAERAVAYWFVYDPAGRPLHLYVDGRVHGRAIQGTAYSGRGMRFGTFDPREHRLERWGEVTVEFSNCGSAELRYDATGPAGVGSGQGTIALTRLSSLAQLPCSAASFPANRDSEGAAP